MSALAALLRPLLQHISYEMYVAFNDSVRRSSILCPGPPPPFDGEKPENFDLRAETGLFKSRVAEQMQLSGLSPSDFANGADDKSGHEPTPLRTILNMVTQYMVVAEDDADTYHGFDNEIYDLKKHCQHLFAVVLELTAAGDNEDVYTELCTIMDTVSDNQEEYDLLESGLRSEHIANMLLDCYVTLKRREPYVYTFECNSGGLVKCTAATNV